MGIVGPANIQCFREPDGSLPVTDVNPRFGGGFPLPTAAGSRVPRARAGARRGERPEPRLGEFREGVLMTRFFSQVILERTAPAASNRRLTPDRRQYPPRDAVRGHRRGRVHRLAPRRGARAPPATRSIGIDCFTDYYDSALKEENARGARRRCGGSTSPRTSSTSRASTASSTSRASRACSSFGDVFPLYLRRNVLASQRVFEAAARDGVRVVFASSSSVYGAAERYPTPEDTQPRPLSPYGITKLACEHLAAAYAREFGARLRRRSATSTPSGRGSGPTWPSRGS